MSDIKKKIDAILEKYSEEYMQLAKESEDLYDKKQELEKLEKALKKKYEDLDDKTGLNKLFLQLQQEKEA